MTNILKKVAASALLAALVRLKSSAKWCMTVRSIGPAICPRTLTLLPLKPYQAMSLFLTIQSILRLLVVCFFLSFIIIIIIIFTNSLFILFYLFYLFYFIYFI